VGKRLALVISVGRFADTGLSPFSTERGSRQLGDLLADPAVGGYETQVLVDPAGTELRIAIQQFFASSARDDLRVLYLSTHGLKDESGRLYLAAQDTQRGLLQATGVSAGFVRDAIADSRCRSTVLLLDCSYSGAFPSEFRGVPGPGSGGDPDIGGWGRMVITSSSAHEYAFERTTRSPAPSGSVFTDALIAGLRTGAADLDGDGIIDAEELFNYLRTTILEAHGDNRQTPTKVTTIVGKLIFARSPRSQASTSSQRPVEAETAGGTGTAFSPTAQVRDNTGPNPGPWSPINRSAGRRTPPRTRRTTTSTARPSPAC
jgi:hypothetical protein